MIPLVIGLKALVVAYAAIASARARYRPGLAALAAIALLSVALPIAIVAGGAGALGALALRHPWAAPLASGAIGALATRAAFRAIDREPDASARVSALEGAAYALLGSTVIDLGLAVIGALAAQFIHDSPFG